MHCLMRDTNVINLYIMAYHTIYFLFSSCRLGVAIFHKSIRDARCNAVTSHLSETTRWTGARDLASASENYRNLGT